MKHIAYLAAFSAIALMAVACLDGGTIGGSIQPSKDKVSTDTATFRLTSRTILTDSILQRNSKAVLGEYTDARFGTTKADFMLQFYCPPSLRFESSVDSVIDDEIDSVFLYLFYDSWYGDSAALFEAAAYPLTQSLDLSQPYCTNLPAAQYVDKSRRLGAVPYSPLSSENEWSDQYDYCVRIPIDTSVVSHIVTDVREHPEWFADYKTFQEYFKGLYVTTTFGNGAFLYVEHAELELCYDYRYLNSDSVWKDTLMASYFPYTTEVRQVNSYDHPDLSAYVSPESDQDSLNYLYAPAGMYTEIDLPMDELCQRLSGCNINYARIKVDATDLDDSQWGLNPPEKLLLINKQDINTFFANFNLSDDLYSYLTEYDEGDDCFVFDISNLVQKSIRYADGDLDSTSTFSPVSSMMLVPVEEVENADGTSLYLLPCTDPSAVKIRSGAHPDQPMIIELVYSQKAEE